MKPDETWNIQLILAKFYLETSKNKTLNQFA